MALAALIEADFTTMNSSPTANEVLVTVPNSAKVTLAAEYAAGQVEAYMGDDTGYRARQMGVWYMLVYMANMAQARFSPAGQELLREARAELEHAQKAAIQRASGLISRAKRTADDAINERHGRT